MRKLSAAIFFLLAAGAAQAGWTIVSAQTETSISGLQHRHVLVENSEIDDHATIELAIFSSKLYSHSERKLNTIQSFLDLLTTN